MKMRNQIAFTAAVLVSSALLGANVRAKLTPAQQEERKYRHFGGYVYQRQKTKVVSIADEQARVRKDTLSRIAAEMEAALTIPVRVNADRDVAVTLKVCEADHAWPLAVLPDNATAIVNVRALSSDSPTEKALEGRVGKELWRGLVYALGGGNTYARQCVMKQVTSLKGLDELDATTACPDAYARIWESAKTLGIIPVRRVTYRRACQEGWAPAPTNAVQKAVWDKVHAMPANPMKIEFDPKKGR